MDAKCPVLKLIWHLKGLGWEPRADTVVHESMVIGAFDCQEAMKFKTYFQCLCTLGEVLERTSKLPSRQPIAYYRLLLRGIDAEPYGSSKDCMVVLNRDLRRRGKQIEIPALEDEPVAPPPSSDIIIAGPEVPAAKPRPHRPSAPGPSRGGGTGSASIGRPGSSGAPGLPPIEDPPRSPEPPPGGPADPPPVHPVQDPPVLVDGIIGGAVLPNPPRRERRDLGRDWKDGLLGAKISYKEYEKNTPGKKPYCNYIIRCTTCEGTCTKTKGRSTRFTKNHGEVEPLAFLHAWLSTTPAPGETHSVTDPTDDEVDAFVNAHHDELMDLFHVLVPNADS